MDDVERLAARVGRGVRVIEAATHPGKHVRDVAVRPRALEVAQLDQHGRERRALDVLHRDVRRAAVLIDLERLDHVRVVEVRGQPRLVEEHRDEVEVVDDVRADPLDDDVLLEPADAGQAAQEHLGHATHPK
jgi:hypothetical protein